MRTGAHGLHDETQRLGDETEPMARDRDAPALARGTLVDRYVITEQLGSGGMGVVYAAYDPELDRRVAIKLLRPSHVGDGQPRLIREAQAIARIAHPNVVAVHDVGELQGSVFVAMEFVDGRTLGRWLRDQTRSVAEIVGVLVQAGRGLAAAHAAELVHRDFKPDNVLVGHDGRVRVLDFGLARGRGSADSIGFHDGASSMASLDEALTEVGTVMGTPAYMSPEQLAGRMATAASDQFSFCVALHEALYGVRPFEGNDMESLSRSVFAGRIREPPPGRSVPAWLRRVILRGLETSPAARYPTMDELLAALTVDRSRRRRRWLAGGAVVGGGLAIAGLAYRSGASAERSPCDAAAAELRTVWSPQRKQALRSAFGALALPHAEDTWTRVAAHVDAYAEGWAQQSVAACEATHVAQTQPAELLERRRRCLGERLHQLDAFLDVLAEPTPTVVDRAVQGVASLPDLDGCRDAAALEAGVAPPEQEATRLRVAAIREDLVRAEALAATADYQAQLALLEPLLEQARQTDYLPIVAGVEHTLARTRLSLDQPEGVELLRAAFRHAIASGDDRRAAMVAVDLGHQLGAVERLHERGHEWLEIARALVQRMGGAPRIEIGITNNLAIIAIRQAHYDQALELFERLVEQQRALDPESPNLAVALMNLGSAYAERRELDTARVYLEQAVELTERVLGPKHPSMTALYANLSLIAVMQGHYEQAEEQLDRTLALQLEVLGRDNLEVARSLASMAIVQRNLGRPERSEQLHREALAIRRDKLEAGHPEIAESMRNLAQAVLDQGRTAEALALAQQAQQIAHERLEPEHPEHGIHASLVAALLLEAGEPQAALAEAERALEILQVRGRSPTATLEARGALGAAQRELGRLESSRATLEQALELAETHEASAGERGRVRLELSRSLQATDPRRARAAAEQALRELQEAGAGYRREADRARQWLSELPPAE
ncbi:MAG: serine/threonine protein kinase [Myxococcales bacterium]|nr:serine/threonine protein kinase [Myxococcales bacterium]